jgi:hypothetical protein
MIVPIRCSCRIDTDDELSDEAKKVVKAGKPVVIAKQTIVASAKSKMYRACQRWRLNWTRRDIAGFTPKFTGVRWTFT